MTNADPLVERGLELETIEAVVAGARDGAGGALVIEGPPGIGKSSLLGAARRVAGEVRVASARGSELEHEFPLGIARQLLEPVLAGATRDERDVLLAGAGLFGADVIGQPRAAKSDGAELGTALHGLYWFAVNLATLRPLLVLVDDVQWADLTSLRWLAYLASRLDGTPIALIVAVRLGEAREGQTSAGRARVGARGERVVPGRG